MDLYAVRLGLDAFHRVTATAGNFVSQWLPDFSPAYAVKLGEVGLGPWRSRCSAQRPPRLHRRPDTCQAACVLARPAAPEPEGGISRVRRIYATLEQFAAWAGRVCPQPGAKRLLSRASQDIDAALLTAFYSTDEAGFPTDAAVREVLAEATCALRPLPPGATVLRSPPRCRPAPSFSRSPNSSSGPIGKEKVDELTNPKQVVE